MIDFSRQGQYGWDAPDGLKTGVDTPVLEWLMVLGQILAWWVMANSTIRTTLIANDLESIYDQPPTGCWLWFDFENLRELSGIDGWELTFDCWRLTTDNGRRMTVEWRCYMIACLTAVTVARDSRSRQVLLSTLTVADGTSVVARFASVPALWKMWCCLLIYSRVEDLSGRLQLVGLYTWPLDSSGPLLRLCIIGMLLVHCWYTVGNTMMWEMQCWVSESCCVMESCLLVRWMETTERRSFLNMS